MCCIQFANIDVGSVSFRRVALFIEEVLLKFSQNNNK